MCGYYVDESPLLALQSVVLQLCLAQD
jgi:hypothetical protein